MAAGAKDKLTFGLVEAKSVDLTDTDEVVSSPGIVDCVCISVPTAVVPVQNMPKIKTKILEHD